MKKVVVGFILAICMGLLPLNVLAVELGHDPICDTITDPVALEASGCTAPAEGEASVGQVAQNIINVVIAVLGLVAVIFVIVGAVQYMTSQGDPGKAKKARDTIVYAILGVVLAALAYTIVNFVLGTVFSGGQ
ncbi:hypothetical protein IJ114_01265 [Candidatus Saccharibacteria bacterium]|nr:hypothetical protein [Candidatus Saccharibacteria bacterium]